MQGRLPGYSTLRIEDCAQTEGDGRSHPLASSQWFHTPSTLQGPKDDVWSLVYSLLDLVVGSLPWTGLKGKKRIYQAKCKPMELKT